MLNPFCRRVKESLKYFWKNDVGDLWGLIAIVSLACAPYSTVFESSFNSQLLGVHLPALFSEKFSYLLASSLIFLLFGIKNIAL